MAALPEWLAPIMLVHNARLDTDIAVGAANCALNQSSLQPDVQPMHMLGIRNLFPHIGKAQQGLSGSRLVQPEVRVALTDTQLARKRR